MAARAILITNGRETFSPMILFLKFTACFRSTVSFKSIRINVSGSIKSKGKNSITKSMIINIAIEMVTWYSNN